MAKNPDKELAESILNAVNTYSYDNKEFVDTIMRGHRTLQQSTFELFLAVIKAWSELSENYYDDRNSYTVNRSKEIMKLLDGCARTPTI